MPAPSLCPSIAPSRHLGRHLHLHHRRRRFPQCDNTLHHGAFINGIGGAVLRPGGHLAPYGIFSRLRWHHCHILTVAFRRGNPAILGHMTSRIHLGQILGAPSDNSPNLRHPPLSWQLSAMHTHVHTLCTCICLLVQPCNTHPTSTAPCLRQHHCIAMPPWFRLHLIVWSATSRILNGVDFAGR